MEKADTCGDKGGNEEGGVKTKRVGVKEVG